jgi:hypothetical protein
MLTLDKDSLELLPDLMNEIHDRYFHFDDIVFSQDTGEWKMLLGEKRKRLLGKVIVSKVLKITRVTHCNCTDIAGIGQNSINQIHIDLDKKTINMECNAPAEIRLSITPDFEISVENKEPK